MNSNIELTQMLISKFCHDLAGTMGAAENAIEFLNSTNEQIRRKAVDLISLSSSQSIINLRFFREAYGISNSTENGMSVAEIHELSSLFIQNKYKAEFHFLSSGYNELEASMPLEFSRLILCLIAIAASNLLRGGVVSVEIDKENGNKTTVSSTGPMIKINEEYRGILCGSAKYSKLSTLNVHYYYTKQLIDELHANLTISSDTEKVEYLIHSF